MSKTNLEAVADERLLLPPARTNGRHCHIEGARHVISLTRKRGDPVLSTVFTPLELLAAPTFYVSPCCRWYGPLSSSD